MASSKPLRLPFSNPSLVMSSIRLSLSSSRMTIFSPCRVGMVETRKSSSLSLPWNFILSLIRPSWGRRFSAMSSLERILTREAMASLSFMGGFMTS